MSFYFDDEPQSQQGGDEGFVCATCGGTSAYPDSNTGALCCDSCFTQSQVLPDTELEFEEVQALAARTSYGRVIGTSRRKKGAGTQTPKKNLEEFDTSKPFPNLVTCLHGMQQVMKHCIETLCDLVGLDDSNDVEKTVQSLWMSYLRAWTDGAEFYGKLHPEIRFSFRDYFLPGPHKAIILKHLSHRAACTVREEKEKSEDFQDREPSSTQEHDIPSDSNLTRRHGHSIAPFRESYHRHTSLMWLYWNRGKRGRLEAALMTTPSMRLVVCLLWLGISRAGVTLHHMLAWISNGALPLQNAFHHVLSEEEQKALAKVSTFFRMNKLPTVSGMENLVGTLVVACGLKSFSHLHGVPKKSPDNAVIETSESTNEAGKRPAANETVTRPDFSYITPDSVPLLTARLIEDLGFEKQILDRSFALMGILKKAPSNLWLPAPLQGARPEHLSTTPHVLAVIAAACKMTPGWETWVYPRPTGKEQINKVHDVNNSQEDEREIKRRRTESIKNRFVPHNEENFRLLSNGPMMEGYLDFLEDNILDGQEATFPKLLSLLETSNGKEDTDCTESEAVVRRQPVAKESRDPFGGQRIWKRQKFHDWYLRLGMKRAKWADANGLGEYVIYTDPKTKRIPLPEPFHPQYGLLIEYMSHKANVKPSEIHAAVAVLDREVMWLARPQVAKKVRRTRDKKVIGEAVSAEVCVPETEVNVGVETQMETVVTVGVETQTETHKWLAKDGLYYDDYTAMRNANVRVNEAHLRTLGLYEFKDKRTNAPKKTTKKSQTQTAVRRSGRTMAARATSTNYVAGL
jgi:hypothetical protein